MVEQQTSTRVQKTNGDMDTEEWLKEYITTERLEGSELIFTTWGKKE